MTQQRYRNAMTTTHMLNMALGDPDNYYEVRRGDNSIAINISERTGTTYWYSNNRVVSEKEIQEILARWSVEGVI